MNNGLSKGGAPVTYEAFHQVPGLEDVWQLHASSDAGNANFASPYIAKALFIGSSWLRARTARSQCSTSERASGRPTRLNRGDGIREPRRTRGPPRGFARLRGIETSCARCATG
jgi:hypothetical protein